MNKRVRRWSDAWSCYLLKSGVRTHRAALTGQQFQGEGNEPYYILFEDFTHVKFYRYSLRAVVEREGGSFDRFVHVDDWAPPVVRTATKGDDPRRTP